MNAGIDMIHLHAKPEGYRVFDASKFKHNKGVCQYGDDLPTWGFSAIGQPLTGTLFENRTVDKVIPASITCSQKGLSIQLNPSKLLHPYELTADISHTTDLLNAQLQRFGIETDLNSMTVSRCDLTKQAVMKDQIQSYFGAFTALQGKRMKDKKLYPDGFQIGNKTRSGVFYDKHKEAQRNGITTPQNMLRCEARWNTNRVIGNTKTGLGIGTFGQLLAADPEHLNFSYNRFLLNDIFRTTQPTQLSFDFSVEVDIIRSFIEANKYPKRAVDKYIMSAGLDYLLHSFGGIDPFGEVLSNHFDIDRATVWRIKKELTRQLHQNRFIDQRRAKKDTISARIDQLLKTFAA